MPILTDSHGRVLESASGSYMDTLKELCQAILDDPKFAEVSESFHAFMQDPSAQQAFSAMQSKSQELQGRQQAGEELSDAEIGEYETLREALMENPRGMAFLEGQNTMGEIHETVQSWVGLTLQNSRLPTEDDFKESGG